MSKEILITNGIAAAVLGGISAALGGWSVALQLLTYLIVADYATGLMVGYISKTLSSQIGFKGLFRKMVIFVIIVIMALMDKMINTSFLRDLAVFFYISNEGLSLLENTAKLGVPYPPQLKDALVQLGKMSDKKIEESKKEA